MIKILLGGSPCTFWSIAQKNGRETEPAGLGWELFKNYLIARDKFKPDYFLYENNESAAPAIKDQISKELNVDLMHINSALVSAQTRKRFYAFNWTVNQPKDRGIVLRDVLEEVTDEISYQIVHKTTPKARSGLIRIGDIGTTAQAHRVYSCEGKSVTLSANGGGQGGKTGLYLCPNGDVRKLTVTECCRLQTLPDDYCRVVCNSQAYKGLGNGWTAEVIIHILNGVLKDVPKNEEIVVLSMYDGIATGRYCLDKMGFTNVRYYAYEIDKYAKQIAMKNYPDIIQLGDAFDIRCPDWTIGY